MLFHPKLKTENLILRKWLYSDLQDLYNYAKVDIIGRMSGWRPHTSIYYSEQVLKNTFLDKFHFAISLKKNNKLIGSICLIPCKRKYENSNKKAAELGYWIGKPYWNKGYATEAAKKIIEFGFRYKRYEVIWAGALHINKASINVLTKCGFKYMYSRRDHFLPDLNLLQKEDLFKLEI